MPGIWLRRFTVCMITATALQATPPLTQIQDILYKANGTLFEGVAQVEWTPFQASDGTQVASNTLSMRIVRGQLRVSLVPTTNAVTPVYYTVRFNSEGKTQFVEYWAVPATSGVVRLREIRITGPTGSSGNLTTGTVAITDVSGLRTELDLRPARGAGWIPGRAAIIGGTGGLEAAAGSAGDCVHVDGSSGPCGTTVLYIDGETPSGAVNGTNPTFRLGTEPNPAASLRLFRNGLLMQPGVEFTLNSNIVTMAGNRIPLAGDIIQAWYRTSGPANSVVDGEVPVGSVDGVNTTFTLASAPLPAASLQVYRNGVLQKLNVDYAVSANTLSFWPFSTPVPGDIIQATYRK